MKNRTVGTWIAVTIHVIACADNLSDPYPVGTIVDRRMKETRHLNLTYQFAPIESGREWRRYAENLRQHVLVSTGLYPMPEKTALNARVFDRIEREEYTVEKVYFESYPGFFVTGNLYRPRGKRGPFPAVLNPHGHWSNGRYANEAIGSIPARCIMFARMGYVAFSWDMVGYNDCKQIDHKFADPKTDEGRRANLWGVSLMGLQLWNSIRATDFLESLPDVDKRRIACTGESGGGTQTFMLCAVDDRIRLAAPVNMISAHMQGGCLCENGPNLRLDTNNMEIGAIFAPRPMMMIACTGDWTKNTPTVEFPAIERIYKLCGTAGDRVAYMQQKADHNYNKQSREAVYGWFAHYFSRHAPTDPIREKFYKMEKKEDLQVFTSKPPGDVNAATLIRSSIESREKQLLALLPRDRRGLNHFRDIMQPALRHALAVQPIEPKSVSSESRGNARVSNANVQSLVIAVPSRGWQIPAQLFTPDRPRGSATLLVHSQGKAAVANGGNGKFSALLNELLDRGETVLAIDGFGIGEASGKRDEKVDYFTTYNRTEISNRVQDILTSIAFLQKTGKRTIRLVGLEDGGLWCLLARPFAPDVERTVADVAQFASTDDAAYLQRLFVPSLRQAGDFRTAGALIAPGRIFLHNTGDAFKTDSLTDAYRASNATNNLRLESQPASAATIADWLTAGKPKTAAGSSITKLVSSLP